jgi:hypothetical protein
MYICIYVYMYIYYNNILKKYGNMENMPNMPNMPKKFLLVESQDAKKRVEIRSTKPYDSALHLLRTMDVKPLMDNMQRN